MKKLSLFLLMIFSSAFAFSQSKMACCKESATKQFAMLASDKKFVMSHANNLYYNVGSTQYAEIECLHKYCSYRLTKLCDI